MPQPIAKTRVRTVAPLFVIGAALAVLLLGQSLPGVEPPLLDDRLIEFDKTRDDYQVLFFGSSRIFRGVDPLVFDAVLAERGHALRSYNLGFPAMRPHEMNGLLRRVLLDPPANLEYVVVELMDWSPVLFDALPDERFVNNGRFTARALAWHDLPETRSVLQSTWIADLPGSTKVELAGVHLNHWLARTFRVGESAMALRRWIAPEVGQPSYADREGRGYTPFVSKDYEEGFPSYFRRDFEAKRDRYRRLIGNLAAANAAPASTATYNHRALEAQIATIRAVGATPVHLLPSRGSATAMLHEVAAEGSLSLFLNFTDPKVDGELLKVENRFDAQHLNPTGAAIFSRLLGERFADLLEAR